MKKFKKYLPAIGFTLVALLVCVREVGATTVSAPAQCGNFDEDQIEVLRFAYKRGSEYNMGWTLAAIAWQESVAGKYPVNWSDPSYGIFHILLKTASAQEGVDMKRDPYRAQGIANQLLYDWDYSADHALEVLLYWYSYHDGDWNRVWSSYNAGFNFKGDKGVNYSKIIAKKIRFLTSNCASLIVN